MRFSLTGVPYASPSQQFWDETTSPVTVCVNAFVIQVIQRCGMGSLQRIRSKSSMHGSIVQTEG